jgi:hypothetical protein
LKWPFLDEVVVWDGLCLLASDWRFTAIDVPLSCLFFRLSTLETTMLERRCSSLEIGGRADGLFEACAGGREGGKQSFQVICAKESAGGGTDVLPLSQPKDCPLILPLL